MVSSVILKNKVQELLGQQYKCVAFHNYLTSFTQPIETPQGGMYTMDAQAFEIDKGFIPCVVKCVEPEPNSAPYFYKSLTYELTFSVPLNVNKMDMYGKLLERTEFDFFGDYRKLWQAVNFKELTFDNKAELDDFITINYDPEKHPVTRVITPQSTSWWVIEIDMPLPFAHTNFKVNVDETEDMYFDYADSVFSIHIKKETLELQQGATTQEKAENFILSLGQVEIEAWRGTRFYKGRMTVGEPAMVGREYDKQERLLWSISGKLELHDESVSTGADYKVAISKDGTTFYDIHNHSNFAILADRDANGIQKSENLTNELYSSTKAHTISFSFLDDKSGAAKILHDIIDINRDAISSGLTHKKSKLLVRLYYDGVSRKEFWAVVSATYNAASVASVGLFTVTLIDDGIPEV